MPTGMPTYLTFRTSCNVTPRLLIYLPLFQTLRCTCALRLRCGATTGPIWKLGNVCYYLTILSPYRSLHIKNELQYLSILFMCVFCLRTYSDADVLAVERVTFVPIVPNVTVKRVQVFFLSLIKCFAHCHVILCMFAFLMCVQRY